MPQKTKAKHYSLTPLITAGAGLHCLTCLHFERIGLYAPSTLVELVGIEPTTLGLQSRCSPS